jgi:hypothetical protein
VQLFSITGARFYFRRFCFLRAETVCFGSEAAGSLRFSDSMAWGAASGQKRTFDGRESPALDARRLRGLLIITCPKENAPLSAGRFRRAVSLRKYLYTSLAVSPCGIPRRCPVVSAGTGGLPPIHTRHHLPAPSTACPRR